MTSDESKMSEAEFAEYADRKEADMKAQFGVADRACGECTACCTVMAVDELGKFMNMRCPHDAGGCCAIYASRPRSCRGWACSWLLGHIAGDLRRRPDKSGLVFNQEELGGKFMFVAIEAWPGAAKESSNAYFIKKMSQSTPIIVRKYEDCRHDVIAPNAAQCQRLLRSIEKEWDPGLQRKLQARNNFIAQQNAARQNAAQQGAAPPSYFTQVVVGNVPPAK
ncbi:MAG TPA: hypothetical protein VMF30_02505 [Pirellulales bacterium]|nr:hypothetical protein [Pirellulales bacterium]